MPPIRFAINPDIIGKFPKITVAAVRTRGLTEVLENIDLETLIKQSVAALQEKCLDINTISETDYIKPWREAYSRSGYSPSKYRSSIESLLRRALKSPEGIKTGIRVVDFYNALSIRNIAPMGGYDLAKLVHPMLELRFAREDDTFEPLGGKPADFPIKTSGVIYASGHDVLCYGFNHRDSARTCLDERTDAALFCGEAVDDATADRLSQAMKDLTNQLTAARAEVSDILVLNADKPSGILS